MRPLRLVLKGFTSFRDEQSIDFSALDIFAIAGPTGAGKSSILDAITYALYGRVDRVTDEVRQLISQGLSRMAVTLDFRVGKDDYRITRSTPMQGLARVVLERLVDGVAQSYGEGADRARDVRDHITKLIGLDYDAFTRSVLLPQGKFAELLTGDHKKRREILTELLDLGLFERMGKRAGAISRGAKDQAEAKAEVLAKEYAGVDADALRTAQDDAKTAAARLETASTAVTRVSRLADEWQQAKRTADDLATCGSEANGIADNANSAVKILRDLASQIESMAERISVAGEGARAARIARDRAHKDVVAAERKWGKVTDLAEAKVRAVDLPKLRQAAEKAVQALKRSTDKRPQFESSVREAAAAVKAAQENVKTAAGSLTAARKKLSDAEHVDKVATLVAGLKKGDPCPVCAKPLQQIPASVKSAAVALRTAATAVEKAELAVEGARTDVTDLKVAHETAKNKLAALDEEIAQKSSALENSNLAVTDAENEIKRILGTLPADPAAEVAQRLTKVQELAKAEQDATTGVADAEGVLREVQQGQSELATKISGERAKLVVSTDALYARIKKLGLGEKDLPELPQAPANDASASALIEIGRELFQKLHGLGTRLDEVAQERRKTEPVLLSKANVAAEGLTDPATDLDELLTTVRSVERFAVGNAATMKLRAEGLEKRLANKTALEAEIASLAKRGQIFGAIALELRADRIIAFLQEEALRSLALAASAHLFRLSEERYTLVCRDRDEFFVVDHWNGDEERHVRTLSGGECFLASLSLALSLAEQVHSLATTERAKLESLFLDEGFGSLDPDALRTVTNAIHELAGGGRLVGVITHLKELTEQFVRIEVEKSPRGSALRLVT